MLPRPTAKGRREALLTAHCERAQGLLPFEKESKRCHVRVGHPAEVQTGQAWKTVRESVLVERPRPHRVDEVAVVRPPPGAAHEAEDGPRFQVRLRGMR